MHDTREHPMTRFPEILDLLRAEGIPFRLSDPGGAVTLREVETSPDTLRRLGFRVGKGFGSIRYLVYYDGKFCGVIR